MEKIFNNGSLLFNIRKGREGRIQKIKMKYLHNGVWFSFLARHFEYDIFGIGSLRILVDRKTKRVIKEFMLSENKIITSKK